MMLEFWYSERCTREIKLISSIVVCGIIYYCSGIEKLSTTLTMICLGIGVVAHLLHQQSLKISENNPYAQGFKTLFSIAPIVAVILVICLLAPQHKLFTAIQAIGFSALGLFIVSIYQNRVKRFE